jgi:hypothetical protein
LDSCLILSKTTCVQQDICAWMRFWACDAAWHVTCLAFGHDGTGSGHGRPGAGWWCAPSGLERTQEAAVQTTASITAPLTRPPRPAGQVRGDKRFPPGIALCVRHSRAVKSFLQQWKLARRPLKLSTQCR